MWHSYNYTAISSNFTSARAGCSFQWASVLTRVIACILQALLQMLFLELQYFFWGIRYLTFRIYLAARHYYGHVAAIRILILTNCYGITNLLLRKFTFTENQTFLQNFWSYTVVMCMYMQLWISLRIIHNICIL